MADGEARGQSLGAVIKKKDEEPALFLEMRRCEKERGVAATATAADQLLLSGDAVAADGVLLLDPPPPTEPKLAVYKVAGAGLRRAPGGADDFLNADAGDKKDYDWSGRVHGVGLVHAPFPLLPARFPASFSKQACELAPIFNELVDHVSLDGEFLQSALSRTLLNQYGEVLGLDPKRIPRNWAATQFAEALGEAWAEYNNDRLMFSMQHEMYYSEFIENELMQGVNFTARRAAVSAK